MTKDNINTVDTKHLSALRHRRLLPCATEGYAGSARRMTESPPLTSGGTKENFLCLKKSVLKTLAYYRAVKTPLTLAQAGRYLISENSRAPVGQKLENSRLNQSRDNLLSEIKNILDSLVDEKIVMEEKGLYWLSKSCDMQHTTCDINAAKKIRDPGDFGSNFPRRISRVACQFIQREKTAQGKINKVRKALKIFRFVPFLKGLFICGSVARKVSRPGSDIDFLVLTKQNRIWTVRFFLTVLAFLLRKKTKDAIPRFTNCLPTLPTGRQSRQAGDSRFTNRKDKFCLNHYRSSSHLKLEGELQDLYSAQEYARMINIYSGNRIDRKFFKKNKKWMRKFLPNFNFTKLPLYTIYDLQLMTYNFLENVLSGKFGDIMEKLLFYLQSRKIALGRGLPPTQQNCSGKWHVSIKNSERIVTNENVIMFHLNPQSPKVLERYVRIATSIIQ